MKYLYKISSIAAAMALIFGLSFSASFAQNYNTNNQTSNSKQHTLKGKVVSSQGNKKVSNAKVMILKSTQMNKQQTNTNMKTDTSTTAGSNYKRTSGSQTPLKSATTGKDGSFKIKNVPGGTYTIKVKANGYQTWTKQVSVNKNKSVTVKLKSS
jgi:uncharacterized membrane protein